MTTLFPFIVPFTTGHASNSCSCNRNNNTPASLNATIMPPHLRFFIVRPEVTTQTPTGAAHKQLGPIVPLIPADELPDWLDIVDAPRELTVEQTVTLSNLGTF